MSVIPVAVDALVAVLRAAPTLSGVRVFDGPEAVWPDAELVAVGLSPEDLTVTSTRTPRGLRATRDSADVICLARSWAGDTLVKPRRDRAFALYDAVVALVEADPTLGGACSHSEVTGAAYMPAQTRTGVVVDVVFVVQARIF